MASPRSVLAALAVVCAALAAGAAGVREAGAWTFSFHFTSKQKEAARALREMLRLCVDASSAALSRPGAFADDPARRVRLPEPLGAFRGQWSALGRSGALDRLEAAMNQAAEAAAGAARTPMLSAVATLEFQDAVGLVRAGGDAGVGLFAMRARKGLELELRPMMDRELERAGAYAALEEAANIADAEARAPGMRQKVIDATLAATLDALFAAAREEERAVRAAPGERGSALMAKVLAPAPR